MRSMDKHDDLSVRRLPEEELMERTLRPKRFTEYVGQRSVTDNLKIYMKL